VAIPDFNANGVLPPHNGMPVGRPISASDLSPFPATSLEVCQKFAFTPDRREILRGWLTFRDVLRQIGHNNGFQWLDGSFMEDVENRRARSPGDIDVVSFLPPSPPTIDPRILAILTDENLTKHHFKVHHFIVRLNWAGDAIVENTRFLAGLFSHRKDDGVWKGMLRVDLNTVADDRAAATYLTTLGTP
jgi:hypothetical protein